MEEGKVKLLSGSLSGWVDSMQQSLTRVRDEMAVLEGEEGRMSEGWEAEAKEEWEAAFGRELERVEKCIRDMETLIVRTVECAQELAQTEKKLIMAAQRL